MPGSLPLPERMPHARPSLFDGRDVGQLFARGGLGAVLLAVGWYQVSDRLLLDDQAPWLALAVGGLVLFCASGALWIAQLRRAVSIRTAEVRQHAGALIDAETPWHPGADTPTGPLVAPVVPGARFFHRPDCALAIGHDLVAGTAADHAGAGRTACETCLPSEDDGDG